MDSEIKDLLSDLQEDIDDLSETLKPLVTTPLFETATKLPVADKAKLYVLTTYAIESLLYSYLRLNNVKTKEHPIMRELARVKQYVQKIKDAEAKAASVQSRAAAGGPGGAAVAAEGGMVLDKAAAGRFIKHSLAGNEQYDKEREERVAREKARAHIKLVELSKKIGSAQETDRRTKGENFATREDETMDEDETLEVFDHEQEQDPMEVVPPVVGPEFDANNNEDEISSGTSAQLERDKRAQDKLAKKARKRQKRERQKAEKRQAEEAPYSEPEHVSHQPNDEEVEDNGASIPGSPPYKKRKESKKSQTQDDDEEMGGTIAIAQPAPLKKKKKKQVL